MGLTDVFVLYSTRSTFTREQVIEIYSLKSERGNQTVASLAQRHGVTTKAVRDIWRGRTWSDVTSESSYRTKMDALNSGLDIAAKRRKTAEKKNDKEKVRSILSTKLNNQRLST